MHRYAIPRHPERIHCGWGKQIGVAHDRRLRAVVEPVLTVGKKILRREAVGRRPEKRRGCIPDKDVLFLVDLVVDAAYVLAFVDSRDLSKTRLTARIARDRQRRSKFQRRRVEQRRNQLQTGWIASHE